MTQKEQTIIKEVIKSIDSECNGLEEMFLQTKIINFRWVKQSLEEQTGKLKNLIN